MDYVNLGCSGLRISRIALGMMTFGSPQWRAWVRSEDEAIPVVRRALDAGINVFDTADLYSAGESEAITGRLLRQYAPRDEIVIATKVYFPVDLDFKGGNSTAAQPPKRPNMSGLSRKRILNAVDASLARLGVDHIDLYQIHRFDRDTPVEETMEALHDVVKAGKVRYLGASSMWAWQLASMQFAAERHGWTKFVSMQCHYNAAYREEEREVIPFCRASGVGVLPWSPLARGFLAGTRAMADKAQQGGSVRANTDDIAQKYYYREADFAVVDAVTRIAQARGVPNAQIAYAWVMQQPGITCPIVGASRPAQLDDALAAMALSLTADELAQIGAVYAPHPVLGHT